MPTPKKAGYNTAGYGITPLNEGIQGFSASSSFLGSVTGVGGGRTTIQDTDNSIHIENLTVEAKGQDANNILTVLKRELKRSGK